MSLEPLLATKMLPPALRGDRIARPRLLERLNEGLRLGRRLALISAPPGFGKTTLMLQWLAQANRPVAWLTLDDGDNEPGQFLRYVSAALGLDAPDGIVGIINALSAAATDRILVLDDYHLVTDFAVHDIITFLLTHQPACLHLVIGTREDPPLPLARLRGLDLVTEVRERNLRFTAEETDVFLNRALGLGIPSQSVAALAARTEGWVTALQLAAVALQGMPSPEQFIGTFAGNDRFIVDYLVEEVLSRQSDPVREFLRQTSVLDRLCAPLCNAVTGVGDARAMLEHLEASNLFLLPLDNRREWWRYHVLFAEMLRLTLPPAEQRALHLKAVAWCEANGLAHLAVHHARRAAELAPSLPAHRVTSAAQPLIEPLSERELEVLRLIAEGLSNHAIGQRLYIAEGTVKRHVNNIYGKLQVGSRTQAVAVARELGLL